MSGQPPVPFSVPPGPLLFDRISASSPRSIALEQSESTPMPTIPAAISNGEPLSVVHVSGAGEMALTDGQSAPIPSSFEGILVSVENSLFGSLVSVTAQRSSEEWVSSSGECISSGTVLSLPVSTSTSTMIQGGVRESQTFFIRTDSGEMLSAVGPSEISGSTVAPNVIQITLSSSTGSLQSYPSQFSFTSLTSAIPGLWFDTSKRRSRSQIYVEILELMKRGPMTPFEIAFYARLNHKRTKEYVEFLKRSGYLETIVEDGRVTYVLTKNGSVFLEGVKALFENNRAATEYANFDYTQKVNRG